MGKLSREKGKRGEREVSQLFREFGFEGRRGQQFKGTSDSPDVVVQAPVPLYVEVKRREALNVPATIEQARSEAPTGAYPVVFHRRDRTPWYVSMEASKFLLLLQQIENDRQKISLMEQEMLDDN